MFSKFIGSFRKNSPTKDGKQRGGTGSHDDKNEKNENQLPERHAYTRPQFLGLSADDEKVIASHSERAIVTPNEVVSKKLPHFAGYAECVNGGKSVRNEDQAIAGKFVLRLPHHLNEEANPDVESIEVCYFCIFDGHAGTGAALMAADQLINHLQEKLMEIVEYLLSLRTNETIANGNLTNSSHYDVTVDSLVKGAIEAAFFSFDEHIATERKTFQIQGGCTVIMALVLLEQLYVAHAGDCRAVAYIGDEIVEMSQEFTPETDAARIQYLAHMNPSLTHEVFSENCYHRPLGRKDLGTKVLFRAPLSSGWYCKTVTQEDIDSPPLVAGRGKWARLMGVIGVTRGFGDHDLKVAATDISVKSFMTATPEIRVLNLAERTFDEDDVLVMGCDGLWDFIKNEDMKTSVRASLIRSREENNNTVCYSQVARDVVHFARGDNEGRGWKMADGRDGSFDDISAFVIPLLHLYKCHNIANNQPECEVKQCEIDEGAELSN